MEGACEAGRRAVNAILDRVGSEAAPAAVWQLEEPAAFEHWKRLDAVLYRRGRPHLFELLGVNTAFQAADLLRRFGALSGIASVDDWLDQVRITGVVDGILTRLGVH